MRQVHTWAAIAALGVAGAALAQTETRPETTEQPGTSVPSTPQTEGTAADRTPPGQTETRDTAPADATGVDPTPSTSQTEGTAADSTPPGETEVGGSARTAAVTGDAMNKHRGSKLIGMPVQTYSGEPLGRIVDVVLDENGRVTHVVIDRSAIPGGEGLVALPWKVASATIQGGNLVMERERLAKAPSFDQGSWPDVSTSQWSAETDRFWAAKGTTR